MLSAPQMVHSWRVTSAFPGCTSHAGNSNRKKFTRKENIMGLVIGVLVIVILVIVIMRLT